MSGHDDQRRAGPGAHEADQGRAGPGAHEPDREWTGPGAHEPGRGWVSPGGPEPDQGWTRPGTYGPDQGRTGPGAYEPDPGWARSQPGFLPPLHDPPDRPAGIGPEHGRPFPVTAPDPPGTGPVNATPLGIMTVVTAVVLMASAFLPWAHARTSITMLGRSLGRDLGSIAGVDADGSGQLIPVLALVALGAIAWGMIAGNPRICTYAAAPGGLAFFCCGVFLVRLNGAQDRLGFGRGGFDYVVTLSYGWFIALVAALTLVGLSLAALLTAPRASVADDDRRGGPPDAPAARQS